MARPTSICFVAGFRSPRKALVHPSLTFTAIAARRGGGGGSVRSLSFLREVRLVLADVVAAIGLIEGVIVGLAMNKAQFWEMEPSIDKFRDYIQKSGVQLELEGALTPRFATNLLILRKIQQHSMGNVYETHGTPITIDEEALRFMRYANAAYGTKVMRAAEYATQGKIITRSNSFTKERIICHILEQANATTVGPNATIDVKIITEANAKEKYLRHFVAVDHYKKAVVLSLRGTFNLPEMLDDVVAFSAPFLGGEAHSAIAELANKTWEKASCTVKDALEKNEGYDLVLTGHSLGGGAACLLNLLLHENNGQLVNGRSARCFAFASPPVFSPIALAPEAMKNAVNFIHKDDVVPFLSIDSVRRLGAGIIKIDDVTKKIGWLKSSQLATGSEPINEELLMSVNKALNQDLKTIEGAPALCIPVGENIWLTEAPTKGGQYIAKKIDSLHLLPHGIQWRTCMIQDHIASRYVCALKNVIKTR